MVQFIPAKNFYKNPSILNTLPADGFDSIKIVAASLDDSEDGLSDRVLSSIGHLKGLVELVLDKSETTDAGAAHAAELPNLQRISAWSAALEGKCLKQFASLKHLHSLTLSRNCLKEENLKYLSALPHLQYLTISHCGVSDAGVKYLANCSSIITLVVENNPKITDQSIKCFTSMKKLRYLRLGDTSITAKGVLELKALPLVWLAVPSRNISPSQLQDIRKAMPNTSVTATTDGRRAVDSDTNAIFAPMH
jgi:Leucine-rich repeat (LRR) protein